MFAPRIKLTTDNSWGIRVLIFRHLLAVAGLASIVSCGGGSSSSDPGADPGASAACDGSCATANSRLLAADVRQIVAQAVAESSARGLLSTIAVVDRVGNVLGVYRMTGASPQITVDSGGGAVGGLEGVRIVSSELGAIAKAVTGAYLSSEGNAFSTRTASQIIQDHFNPGELQQPAGPLFGVQFSQLACSDFTSVFDGAGPSAGPMRSPLGLSGDPGGFPLYRDGTVIGGVGVMSSLPGERPVYTIDRVIIDTDRDAEEIIATAATFGLAAPVSRRADRITAGGKTLRFSDAVVGDLLSAPASVTPAQIPVASGTANLSDPALGSFVAVTGYAVASASDGTAFGQATSGIRSDGDVEYPGRDAFVFVDATNTNRYPPVAGDVLTADEVRSIMSSALSVANEARAQIRIPLSSQARVTISVVDADGDVLAMARTRDAPVFGADVSLQKARTAAFFSSSDAAAQLSGTPQVDYLNDADALAGLGAASSSQPSTYVTAARATLADANAFGDGATAFTSRSVGNLEMPLFPDGIDGRQEGPFSKPPGQWSPFNIGVQLDVSYNGIVRHLAFALGAVGTDVTKKCFGMGAPLAGAASVDNGNVLANGLQMFPGGVPIYRGNTLVGAVGVSGDGVDQDDMIAFLGVARATGDFSNAPAAMRSDRLTPEGVRLRYVQCPQAPFINSSEQNVCSGQ